MKPLTLMGIVSLTLLMAGCDHDEEASSSSTSSYQVSVTNLNNNQPLSPLAVALHDETFQLFTIGDAATIGLERLAEGGDNSVMIEEAIAAGADTATGAGVLMPGASEQLTLVGTGTRMSLAAMLGNTNDGFAGLDTVDLSELLVGESLTLWADGYDAGTEGNSEAMADVPGPAAGGEGFNAARDDSDFVRIHSGVITQDDGLASSVLDGSHRFTGPVAKVVIKRL